MQRINDRRLRVALAAEDLNDIDLYKDEGFFFIDSENDDRVEQLSMLRDLTINVRDFEDLTVPEWVDAIKNIIYNR